MTKNEVTLLKKATALNKIRKLYNPKSKYNFTYYEGEGSLMEQISFEVESIISELELELKSL